MHKTLLTGLTTLAFTALNAEVGLHFSGEFLWWKVAPNNQFVNTHIVTPALPPNVNTGKNVYYTYGWDPGYRFGIDYSLCLANRSVDLYATWTHFNSSDSISFVDPTLTSLTSFAGLNFAGFGDPSYDGHADFSFNRVDAGIAANYFQCNNLSINPSCAFTYVHIKNTIDEVFTTPTTTSTTDIDSNFNGYGITIGANAHYPLMCDFYLYGSTDFSALYGQYNFSQHNLVSTTTLVNNQKSWNMRFIADFNVGIEYFVCLLECMELSVRLGYEFAYLPDMNIIAQVISNSEPDALTINGLVAGLQVGF